MNVLCVMVIVTTHVKTSRVPSNVGAKTDTNLVAIKKVAAVIITLIHVLFFIRKSVLFLVLDFL